MSGPFDDKIPLPEWMVNKKATVIASYWLPLDGGWRAEKALQGASTYMAARLLQLLIEEAPDIKDQVCTFAEQHGVHLETA